MALPSVLVLVSIMTIIKSSRKQFGSQKITTANSVTTLPQRLGGTGLVGCLSVETNFVERRSPSPRAELEYHFVVPWHL